MRDCASKEELLVPMIAIARMNRRVRGDQDGSRDLNWFLVELLHYFIIFGHHDGNMFFMKKVKK